MTAPAPDQDQAPAQVPAPLAPEVLRELRRQLDQSKRDDDAAAEWAKATAEVCSRCGCRESWLRPGKGGWHRDQHGAVCHPCDLDRRSFRRPDGAIMGDDEHRARVIAELIGPERARWQWPPLLVARARELLPWWCEVPGARPGTGAERFAYVDREALAASLRAKPPPPPELVKGPKCPKCKTRDRWEVIERPVSGQAYLVGDKVTPGYIEVRRVCHGDGGRCRYEPEPERRYN
jgi:hypothetical protein